MTTEGDFLLALIRQAVTDMNVPNSQREPIVEIIARTVITVMSDPRLLNRLSVVMALQQENAELRQYIMQLRAFQERYVAHNPPRARKAPPRKKPAKKKAAARPKIQVKGSTAANRRAFKQGYGSG